MRPRTLLYCLVEGIRNLIKNRLMTVASIATIMASLFVVTIFYSVVINLEFTLNEFEHNIGIAVFFNDGVTENEILTLKNQLEAREEVYMVTYVSEEEAWESFKVDYFAGREDLLQGFEGDNPLQGSSSLQIQFEDITQQDSLIQMLEAESIVRYVREAREVAHIVESLNDLVRYISAALIVILSIISLFIVSNTIRLGITMRKREINIMRYIGAKTIMIQGPFVVEGVLIGLFGAALPLIAIFFLYNNVVGNVATQFILLSDFLVFVERGELMSKLMPVVLSSGAVLGFIGSRMTVAKYLKV